MFLYYNFFVQFYVVELLIYVVVYLKYTFTIKCNEKYDVILVIQCSTYKTRKKISSIKNCINKVLLVISSYYLSMK